MQRVGISVLDGPVNAGWPGGTASVGFVLRTALRSGITLPDWRLCPLPGPRPPGKGGAVAPTDHLCSILWCEGRRLMWGLWSRGHSVSPFWHCATIMQSLSQCKEHLLRKVLGRGPMLQDPVPWAVLS